MVDQHYAEPALAALYDLFCPWDPRGDFGFYLPLVMAADRVLDVGCGTGMLLRRARSEGHSGRLRGLDPAIAMLAVARTCEDVEWVAGDLASMRRDQEFDLVVMTGHAFQVLTEDRQLQEALTTVRAVLAPGGRFAFETRNPLARGWTEWTRERVVEVIDPAGITVQLSAEVDLPVTGDLVSFTATYSSPSWERPRYSRSTLRFLDAGTLASVLSAAGLEIEAQYGDWDRSVLSPDSPEIITIARSSDSR